MVKFLSKIVGGYYRVELNSCTFTIHVKGEKSCEKIDQLIDEINKGTSVVDGVPCTGCDVPWKYFEIAKILRRYDPSGANAWCAAEFGGLKGLIKFALGLIGSQWYGAAGELLKNIQELVYTMDKRPVVISEVFEDEAEYQRVLDELKEEDATTTEGE